MAATNANFDAPPGGKGQQGQGQGEGQGGQQGGQQGGKGQGGQGDTGPKKRVYIGNLPPDTSREELRELGSKYGRVINVELIRTKDGRLPFGFVTFLSEEDAGYTAYILHDHVYKNYPLEASLSNSKIQPKTKPGAPRTGPKDAQGKPKKKKKEAYSLRTLTPKNPPTQTNQAPTMKNYTQNLNDDQGLGSPNVPFGWTDNPADVPAQAPLGRGSNTAGIQNQDFSNQPRNNKFNNDSQGSNRKTNNAGRGRGGPSFRPRAQDTSQFEGEEERDDVHHFDNADQIPITVQDSPPALNMIPPQDNKNQGQKTQSNRNPNNNTGKGRQQQQKLGSNSGGPQNDLYVQYTNVQVIIGTGPQKTIQSGKLNASQLEDFLHAINPYVQGQPS